MAFYLTAASIKAKTTKSLNFSFEEITSNKNPQLNPRFKSILFQTNFSPMMITLMWEPHPSLSPSLLPASTNSCSWDQVEELLMGDHHNQKAVSCATATLSAKLPWELSLAEWRDLFHFTADRSTLPGRPLPVSLIHQLCSTSWRLPPRCSTWRTPISAPMFLSDSPLCSLSIWLCPH